MEGTDSYKGDDSHEIAAFMRMFMDMVGITENDTIPAGLGITYFVIIIYFKKKIMGSKFDCPFNGQKYGTHLDLCPCYAPCKASCVFFLIRFKYLFLEVFNTPSMLRVIFYVQIA